MILKTNYKYLLFLSLAYVLSSCVSFHTPESDSNFAEVKTLEEFSGTYRNLGQGGADTTTNYLSNLIWPQAETSEHEAIQTVSIQLASKNEIRMQAIAAGKMVQKQILTEGEDYVFADGKITLLRPSSDATSKMTMQSHTKTVIGLDAVGYEKYRRIGAAAGAMLLAFPVAIVDNNHVRYERVE